MIDKTEQATTEAPQTVVPSDLTGRLIHIQTDVNLDRWLAKPRPISLETGEEIVMVGEPGSGKSSVAEMIGHLLHPGVVIVAQGNCRSMSQTEIDAFTVEVQRMVVEAFRPNLLDRMAVLVSADFDELPQSDAQTPADWNVMVDRYIDIALSEANKGPHMVLVNEAHTMGTAMAKNLSKSMFRAEREEREGHRQFEHRRPDGSYKKGRGFKKSRRR